MNESLVVTESIGNELTPQDIEKISLLKEKGYTLYYYYYLPRVPPEMTQLESVNKKILHWLHRLRRPPITASDPGTSAPSGAPRSNTVIRLLSRVPHLRSLTVTGCLDNGNR